MKKTLLSISLAVSAALLLTACKTTEPYYSYSFEPNAQIQRAWHRIDAKDIGVEQVRVVKIIDLDCAGDRIAVPGEGEFSDLRDAFAHYWKNAFITDLSSVGMLNQEKPKVKLYNLIDSVKLLLSRLSFNGGSKWKSFLPMAVCLNKKLPITLRLTV